MKSSGKVDDNCPHNKHELEWGRQYKHCVPEEEEPINCTTLMKWTVFKNKTKTITWDVVTLYKILGWTVTG